MHAHASTRTLVSLAILAVITTSSALAQGERQQLPAGLRTNAGAKFSNDAVTTVNMSQLTPAQLVQALVGPGVTVSNIVFNGAAVSAGTFTGALASIGFDSGIILSSGDIASVVGPNTSDWMSTDNQGSGDTDLDALTTAPTYDACTLEFDFSCPTANQISFQYVFSSEEFNEWVNTQFNDVFGFFLNGQNIAVLPGGMSVAINNVNCGNPYVANSGGNCFLFVNNSCADLPVGAFPCTGPVDTEMDGLTVVLTATGTLLPGTNHIKLAIADAGDNIYDSNVFIRGQSFTCGAPGPYFPSAPCDGDAMQASIGVPFNYTMESQTATGLGNNAVTLSVGAVPAGLTHSPSLPLTVAGQNVAATTVASWTPTAAQAGLHHIVYTSTDQLQETENCHIQIVVSEVYLLLGDSALNWTIPGTGGRKLLTNFSLSIPASMGNMPAFDIPNIPALTGLHFFAQVAMYNPTSYPTEPLRMSNGLNITLGVGSSSFGPSGPDLTLWLGQPPLLGTTSDIRFSID